MRLQVTHETHYIYSTPVHALAMEARLQPCNDQYQSRQQFRLMISPKTAIEEYTTFNDMQVQYWTLLKASEADIVSESVVDIYERPLTAIDVAPLELDPITFYPYLHETPLTRTDSKIEAFASQFVKLAGEDWYQTTLSVRDVIHDTIEFETGHTTTQTVAADVLRMRQGVCQDFTHLMLATLRMLGIPARYVSGYLNQDTTSESIQRQEISDSRMYQYQEQSSAEQNTPLLTSAVNTFRLRGTGASHAWCEVYFGPQEGWRGFDPANNLLVDQNYVRIGAGRDYNDVTPVKGVHKGPAEEDLKVTVTVNRVR